MKKYKRLTFRADGGIGLDCKACHYDRKTCMRRGEREKCGLAVRERLAELEDEIELGTLIELPCCVGDTVWKAEENGDGLLIYGVVENIDYKWILDQKRGNRAVLQTCFKAFSPEVFHRIGMWDKAIFGFIFEFAEIGKSVFLTEAEAQKALKELRNE